MTRAEELIASDFESFVRKVFSTLNSGQTLGKQNYVRHICRAVAPLQKGEINRLVVNLPPRHLKTVIVSISLSAWHLAQHPSDNIIVVAYSDKLAGDIAYHIRRVLCSGWFQKIFATRIAPDRGSVNDFGTIQGGGVYAVSIAGSITGRGANLIIFDDPLNIKDADNDAIREALNARFDDVVLSRLNNPANDKFVLVGHRLHEDDLSAMLLARGYRHLCLPFIAPEDAVYGDWGRPKGSVLRPDAFDAV